jgi:hypothetical protein
MKHFGFVRLLRLNKLNYHVDTRCSLYEFLFWPKPFLPWFPYDFHKPKNCAQKCISELWPKNDLISHIWPWLHFGYNWHFSIGPRLLKPVVATAADNSGQEPRRGERPNGQQSICHFVRNPKSQILIYICTNTYIFAREFLAGIFGGKNFSPASGKWHYVSMKNLKFGRSMSGSSSVGFLS